MAATQKPPVGRSKSDVMGDAQWNWYATQELAGRLAEQGLVCPKCNTLSRGIVVVEQPGDSHFFCDLCSETFLPEEYIASQNVVATTGETVLYRPVGENELAMVRDSGFTRFPTRLFWQPIFYPVLTQDYAEAIARDWNSTDEKHNHVGFVTRFAVSNEFLSNYDVQTAADGNTLEYWIPAEDLQAFNDNIVGKIEVIAEFRRGDRMVG